jgi:hypothetical protein
VDESDKHQLEGLLQARSEDLRQGRTRRRRPVVDAPAAPPASRQPEGEAAARACAECGEPIAPHRLVALPRATRCLGCQRRSELSASAT